MTLEFNIIYTPGTVRYLSLFVGSLLKWSDACFRLVSNGCLPPERRYLQQLCHGNPRLAFWNMPTKTSMPHCHVLNYLQGMTRADYFCFMDSDIFATGDFLGDLMPYTRQCAGLFSGGSISTTAQDRILPQSFQIMSGWHHQTDSGICLGSTFFAIYDNNILTSIMQATSVGFEEYRWPEIPAEYGDRLVAINIDKEIYDTGKLLNLLLLAYEHKLIYLDSPSLCHIGGVSFLPVIHTRPQGMKAKTLNRLTTGPLAPILQPLVELWRAGTTHRAYKKYTDAEYQTIVAQRRRQRNPTRQYFLRLLQALFANRPLPEILHIGVAEIDRNIETATTNIIALYEEFA